MSDDLFQSYQYSFGSAVYLIVPSAFSLINFLINPRPSRLRRMTLFPAQLSRVINRPLLPGPSFSMKSRMPPTVKPTNVQSPNLRSDFRDVISLHIASMSLDPLTHHTSSFGRLLASCPMCRSRKESDMFIKCRCVRLTSVLKESTSTSAHQGQSSSPAFNQSLCKLDPFASAR